MRVIVVGCLTACGFQHGQAPPSDARAGTSDAPSDASGSDARSSIVIEAEAPTLTSGFGTHAWVAQALLEGFTGSGYITALPDDHANCITPTDLSCPTHHYSITIAVAGTYRVTVRHAAEGTASDSVFWFADTTIIAEGLDPASAAGWRDDTTPPAVALPAGLVTFGLRMRETGARIDSVRLDLQ